jgi:hypothetical protein
MISGGAIAAVAEDMLHYRNPAAGVHREARSPAGLLPRPASVRLEFEPLLHPAYARIVIAIWLCFLARGLFYACSIPVWEGYGEIPEVSRIEAAAGGDVLSPGSQPTAAIARSLELAPLPRFIDEPVRKGALTYDDFWRLPEDERARRDKDLRRLPGVPPPAKTARGHEAPPPPLYHWLMSRLYGAMGKAPLLDRIFVMRVAGVLLASFTVPLVYVIGETVFRDSIAALCAAAAFSVMPQVMFSVTHVGVPALEILLVAAAALAILWVNRPWHAILPGILVGLGLLTSIHFVAIALACVLILIRRWRAAALFLVTALAISGWWYVRTNALSAAMGGASAGGLFAAVFGVDWLHAADFAWNTHLWSGNASFLSLRSWVYSIMLLVFLAAAYGISRSWRTGSHSFAVLLALHTSIVAVVAYHAVAAYRSTGQTVAPGWYLTSVAALEMCLVVYGYRALSLGATSIPAFMLGALDIYGCHVVMMPYYAGLISYSSTGRLAAFPLGRWSYGIFERLAVDKPQWINPPLLAGLWAAYVVCTFSILGIAISAARAGHQAFEQDGVTVDVCRSTD